MKTTQIRIDPFGAIGASASDVMEKATFIPLQTTKESTFGFIGQLSVTKAYFIILDPITNSILIFKKDGTFHNKIVVVNSNKNPEKSIRLFSINTWTQQIIFQLGIIKQSRYYYNYDGNLVKNEMVSEGSLDVSTNVFLAESKTVGSIGYQPNAKFPPYMLNFVDNFTSIYARGIHYDNRLNFTDQYQGYALPQFCNFGVDSTFYYTRLYDYNIYAVGPRSIERKYSFVFPINSSLPLDFISDKMWDHKRSQYLDNHKKIIYSLNNCYQIGNNLIFRTTIYDRPSSPNLIYNLKSGTLIDYNHISSDAMTFFLPISNGYNYSNTGLIACDGENLYTSFSSLNLFNAYETAKDKNITYNPNLTKYFTQGTKQDNPVIFQFKLKNSF